MNLWRESRTDRSSSTTKTDRYLRAHHRPGHATLNVAPWSGLAVAQSRLRWLSMIERPIDSPMPSPPDVVVYRLEQAWRLGLAEAAFSMVTIAQGPSSRWSAIARTTTLRRTGETSHMVLPDLRPDEGSTSRRVASSSEVRSKRRPLGRGVAWRPIGCDHRFFKWRTLLTAGWSDAAERLSTTSIQGETDPYQSRVAPIRPKSGRHFLLATLVWGRIKTNH